MLLIILQATPTIHCFAAPEPQDMHLSHFVDEIPVAELVARSQKNR
jgi:hypothetical protein